MQITAVVKSHRSGVSIHFTNTGRTTTVDHFSGASKIDTVLRSVLSRIAIIGNDIDDIRIRAYRQIQGVINSLEEIYNYRTVGDFIHERIVIQLNGHSLLTLEVRGEEKQIVDTRVYVDSISRIDLKVKDGWG